MIRDLTKSEFHTLKGYQEGLLCVIQNACQLLSQVHINALIAQGYSDRDAKEIAFACAAIDVKNKINFL